MAFSQKEFGTLQYRRIRGRLMRLMRLLMLISTNGNLEITFSESTLAAAAVLRRKEKLIIKVRLEQVFLPGAKLFFHPLLLLFRVSKKKFQIISVR